MSPVQPESPCAGMKAPAQPVSRRTWLAWAAVVALAVVIGTWFLRQSDEPRYEGQPVSYYFPAWKSRAASEEFITARFKGEGDPEAIPFLVEALRWLEARPPDLIAAYWDRVPRQVRSFFPEPIEQEDRCDLAFWRLAELTANPEGLKRLQPAFHDLPPASAANLLRTHQDRPDLAEDMRPLLHHAFRQAHPDVRRSAAVVALKLGAVLPEEVGLALRFLESAPDTSWTVQAGHWRECLASLGALGTNASPALPLLDRLAREAPATLGTQARLAALRVRTPNPDLVRFYEDEVRDADAAVARSFYHAVLPVFPPPSPRALWLRSAEQALPLMIHLLANSPRSKATGTGAETARPSVQWSPEFAALLTARIQALSVILEMGPQARPAAAAAVQCLMDPIQEVRTRAGRFLRKLGPAAPETLPGLVAALVDPDLQDALIPLLGAYGPLASHALPDLHALAAGQWRTNWLWPLRPPEANRVVMDPVLARRYGLKIEAPAPLPSPSPPPAPAHLGPDPRADLVTSEYRMDPALARRYGLKLEDPAPVPGSRRETARQAIQKIAPAAAGDP